jgi:tRNA (mo5U34)-methyltransferase
MSTETASGLTDDEVRALVAGVGYWHHDIELRPGIVTPARASSRPLLDALELPEDLTGMRALDIGCWDGFFTFELERRGAEVVAIDRFPTERTGFPVAKRVLGSAVEPVKANVYEMTPEEYGTFDIVLFLGVIYHLRNPLLALDRLAALCTGRIWVESHVIDDGFVTPQGMVQMDPVSRGFHLAQFYEGDELSGDDSNWFAPTLAGLGAMVRSAGFETERETPVRGRGLVRARRVVDPRKEWLKEFDYAVDVPHPFGENAGSSEG